MENCGKHGPIPNHCSVCCKEARENAKKERRAKWVKEFRELGGRGYGPHGTMGECFRATIFYLEGLTPEEAWVEQEEGDKRFAKKVKIVLSFLVGAGVVGILSIVVRLLGG